jgi:hypothetical protein
MGRMTRRSQPTLSTADLTKPEPGWFEFTVTREHLPDGRQILYFSWPPAEAIAADSADAAPVDDPAAEPSAAWDGAA